MACYHPLLALNVGMTANGKKDIRFLSYKPSEDDNFVLYDGKMYGKERLMQLPCGQCVGCRLEYSRQWANRCMLELEYHDSAYFVTLTYDDSHVPLEYYRNQETGKREISLSLYKRDFQLFMKRLRKAFPNDKIRYFAAGEYGSESFRPHYHAIIYGLHLDDLEVYKKSRLGHIYYNSSSLSRCWINTRDRFLDGRDNFIYQKEKNEDDDDDNGDNFDERNILGYAVVAPVTWETCAYTARYVMKKLNGAEGKFYTDFSLEPPFTVMSRKPGIARQWYEDHPDCYEFDYINISTPTGGRKFSPPRYFDRLYDLEHPDEMAVIKEARSRLAKARMDAKLAKTDKSFEDYLSTEEAEKVSKIKSLRRTIV